MTSQLSDKNELALVRAAMQMAERRADAAEAEISRLRARANPLEDALRSCAEKFREYEAIHQRKLNAAPPDFATEEPLRQKVARNREMAEMCEAALAKPAPDAPVEPPVKCGDEPSTTCDCGCNEPEDL